MTPIFITGGTGYIGKRLIKNLVSLGYDVTALVRRGSENKLPKGVRAIIADPLDASTFQQWIPKGATFIQLIGVNRLSRRGTEKFQQVDLRSVKESANAAALAGVQHFIYISVAATNTGWKKNFSDARKQGEAYIQSKHLVCTFLRPWLVVGPGHYWPLLLMPVFGLARLKPEWKQKTKGMELLNINLLLRTLVKAIEAPPRTQRIFEVSHMKKNSLPTI